MRVGKSESEQRAAEFRAAITATLTGAGLVVGAPGVSHLALTQRGTEAVDVTFVMRRPATLAKGLPWNADGDADRLVARAVMALMPDYAVERVGTGRMTTLTVSALATAVCS